METRHKAAEALAQRGIIGNLSVVQSEFHRWKNRLTFDADTVAVNYLIAELEHVEHQHRRSATSGQRRVKALRYGSLALSFAAGISFAVALERSYQKENALQQPCVKSDNLLAKLSRRSC